MKNETTVPAETKMPPADLATLAPPRVDPVGVLDVGDAARRPRAYTDAQRLAAWVFLLVFVVATLVTSAVTLGAYCLTSDGGDTRAVRERLASDP